MRVPLCIPNIGKEEEKAVIEVLKSKWLVHGPKNDEFEKMLADCVGVKYAASVNSCASALFLALKALGVKGEVILPSFTFAASANVIEQAGCKPVFADIDGKTLNIDPKRMEKAITRKTVAVMPVHVGGLPADMKIIMKIAKRHKLAVIEDSAETIGGEAYGKTAGSFGIGCFSFFPTKNITTGEGGMLTTNEEKIFSLAKIWAAHGISKSTHGREKAGGGARSAVVPGYNMRLSNLLAAIGVEQMKKLKKMNEARRKNAKYLSRGLKSLPITLPYEPKGFKHVYQMYIIQVAPEKRDALLSHLKSREIGATVFSDPPVHLQDYYARKYGRLYKGRLPVTEKAAKSNIILPMYPSMGKKEMDWVIKSVKEFFTGKK